MGRRDTSNLLDEVPIEPERLIDLADSNIGAAILKVRDATAAAALEGKPTGAASSDIDFMRKDLRDMLRCSAAATRTLRSFDGASRGPARSTSVGQRQCHSAAESCW